MTDDEVPARQPLFNAPWPAVAVPLVLLAAYLWQWQTGTEATYFNWGLSADRLRQGAWFTLVTHLFIHGGWSHVGMNCAAAIAFGPPVARYLGSGARGAAGFFAFFIICGVLAGLGFVIANLTGADPAVGASGAISGLWGAATRMRAGRGQLAPVFSRQVVIQSSVVLALNIILGLLGPLAAMHIAWEAHVAGFIAGLFLIGPAGWIMGRRG